MNKYQKALEMYAAGVKVEVIIMETKLNGGMIAQLAEQAGIKKRREVTAERNAKAADDLRAGVPITIIAHDHDIPPSCLYRLAYSLGVKPQRMTIQQKRALKARRQTFQDFAAQA